jgi:hypothetical protein
MKIKKILVVNDSMGVFRAVFSSASDEVRAEFEIVGIWVGGDDERRVITDDGERWAFDQISFCSAVADADIVFLDHQMPIPGDKFIEVLRQAGLPESARIIGTSTEPGCQSYLSELMNFQDLLSPHVWKKALGV